MKNIGKNNLPKASSMILTSSADEVYLQLRDRNANIFYPGKWGLIGGAALPGETPYECIVRECREETNLDITRHEVDIHPFFVLRKHCEETVFLCRLLVSKELIVCREGERIDCFAIKDLDRVDISDYHRDILNIWLRGCFSVKNRVGRIEL